jgi:hypothetical protein
MNRLSQSWFTFRTKKNIVKIILKIGKYFYYEIIDLRHVSKIMR